MVFMMTLSFSTFGQISEPTLQSNSSLSFNNFLSGVNYIEVLTTDEMLKHIENKPSSGDAMILKGVMRYLQEMNFDDIGFSSKFEVSQLPSLCDKAFVDIRYYANDSFINDFTVTFISCDEEWWQFKSSTSIIISNLETIEEKVYKKLKKTIGLHKPVYNKQYRRELSSEKTKWTETELKDYFKINKTDPVEGIYEKTSSTRQISRYKIGVIKINNDYRIVYLGGAQNYEDWIEGEIKADLILTATPSFFKLKWRMANKALNEGPYATFETGLMNVTWPDREKELYIKLFPTQSDNIYNSSIVKSSGTGFGLSSDGYIVTNHHVIEGANKIKILGINGDFAKSYSAEIIIEDKNNDVAIIKVNDPDFTTLGQPPYVINTNIMDMGSSVYVLGYPLRASMGDEVKLTNGIISSKTGFQGDITTYQVSVPVQPGNSGGPLINEKGEVVGIIKAKHSDAENVSYALKTSYLINLIQNMEVKPELSKTNLIASKNLSEQVKFVKEFIYILEIN